MYVTLIYTIRYVRVSVYVCVCVLDLRYTCVCIRVGIVSYVQVHVRIRVYVSRLYVCVSRTGVSTQTCVYVLVYGLSVVSGVRR